MRKDEEEKRLLEKKKEEELKKKFETVKVDQSSASTTSATTLPAPQFNEDETPLFPSVPVVSKDLSQPSLSSLHQVIL